MHPFANRFDEALGLYSPLSLVEMDAVRLLRRTDTKYLMSETQLADALHVLRNDFDVLCIDNRRSARYETLYFDHDALSLYFAHHSQKVQRHKVRMRAYVDSGLAFLEVKLKRKGQTDKRRLPVPRISSELSPEHLQFLSAQGICSDGLAPSLFNAFDRITLVNRARTERLTLDWNIVVAAPGEADAPMAWQGVCIAELKQSGLDRRSPFAQWAKAQQIRPERISKYCMGLADTRPGLKSNRFKAKRRKLSQLTAHAV